MTIRYPVAPNAEAALHAATGFAAREREAQKIASGEAVTFVTESVGPAFDSREAALDAYAGRVEDERPGRPAVPVEARYCTLRPVAAGGPKRRSEPVRPSFENGRRWPARALEPASTKWRLSISYWRIVADEAAAPAPPARRLRRDPAAEALGPGQLWALVDQPLQPVGPQQPLDIGLFETHPPEAPHIVIPDE